MEHSLTQILKQTKKIARILAKVTQQYPQTTSQIDLAMFAALKIQKIVQKYLPSTLQHSHVRPIEDDFAQRQADNYSDPIFDAAMKNVEGFRQAASRLQSKINILVNESEKKGRFMRKQRNGGLRQEVKGTKMYKKSVGNKRSLGKKGVQVQQQAQQQYSESDSRSLQSIDYSIMQINKQILQLQQQQQQQQHPSSYVEQYHKKQ